MKTHLPTTPLPADSLDYSVAASARSVRKGRYFFVGMSVLFFLIALIGFIPSYQGVYTGGLKFHWFAHVHGAIMTSWLVLFLTQSLLAARNNLKYHRRLGQFGFVLGILVYLVMATASVRGRLSFYIPVEDGVWDILLVELSAMNLFGLFFIWGMLVRKNAAAHKRLLFLATMVLLQAAVDRTRFLPGMNIGVNFVYLDLLLIPLFFYDWRVLKRIHRTTLAGTAILIATQLTVTMVWGAPPMAPILVQSI